MVDFLANDLRQLATYVLFRIMCGAFHMNSGILDSIASFLENLHY